MVHNYIIQWVNLAKDNNLVRDFHEGRLGEYNHEIFLGTETSFKHIQDCLTGVGTNNTREINWQYPPQSYWSKIINSTKKVDPVATGVAASGIPTMAQPTGHKKGKKGRSKFNRRALGWLRSERRVNNWPSSLRHICPRFAFVNSECNNSCNLEHKYWCELAPQDQQSARVWVSDNQGISFNADERTGGTNARPRYARP